MSTTFSIPFEAAYSSISSPDLTLRLPEFIGDENNLSVQRFDRFLSDLENRSASGSLTVEQISPLVLYGPSFTAKSCLAIAFAHRIGSLLGCYADGILRISIRDFCHDFAKSIQTKTNNDFRERFEAYRVFVFDDLHQICSKNAAITELQSLLDLFNSNGQAVIFTSPFRPDAINGIGERLASRLVEGLLLPVNLPGRPSKQSMLERLGFSPDDQDQWLNSESSSFAELCNYMVHQKAGLEHSYPNNSSVESSNESRIFEIIELAARHLEVTADEIIGTSRLKTIALARCVCIFVIRKNLNLSFQQIGKIFGNRDHSTIIHSFNKIKKTIKTADPSDIDVINLVEQLSQNVS